MECSMSTGIAHRRDSQGAAAPHLWRVSVLQWNSGEAVWNEGWARPEWHRYI